MNILDFIKQLQQANGNVTVNININNNDIDDDFVEDLEDVEDNVVDTDFEEGDRVMVCHVRHDGTRVHTIGTVIETAQEDDKGYYTRVAGDNGKHYRAGLHYDEERLGTIIYHFEG